MNNEREFGPEEQEHDPRWDNEVECKHCGTLRPAGEDCHNPKCMTNEHYFANDLKPPTRKEGDEECLASVHTAEAAPKQATQIVAHASSPAGEVTKPALVLTEEQESAVTTIIDGFKHWMDQKAIADHPVRYAWTFKLGGYAGTGKTTVIKEIVRRLRSKYSVTVSAFTGKAVNVLERKGVTAQTLHSLMYNAAKENGVFHFYKRTRLDGSPDLVIVDEASMLSTQLNDDLLSFKVPVLYVGDLGQLEPVGDNPDLMKTPDIVLSKIHRQAEQSPIIRLANEVRLGGNLVYSKVDGLHIRDKALSGHDGLWPDQIIAAKNKTRIALNSKIRMFKNLEPFTINASEKLIVLKNNSVYGVFNGMILFVLTIRSVEPSHFVLDLVDEIGRKYLETKVWKEPFRENPKYNVKQPEVPKGLLFCDYGYCITCHKSQGSEWNKVLVLDEWMPASVWDMKRWRYTAITRTVKELVYCL